MALLLLTLPAHAESIGRSWQGWTTELPRGWSVQGDRDDGGFDVEAASGDVVLVRFMPEVGAVDLRALGFVGDGPVLTIEAERGGATHYDTFVVGAAGALELRGTGRVEAGIAAMAKAVAWTSPQPGDVASVVGRYCAASHPELWVAYDGRGASTRPGSTVTPDAAPIADNYAVEGDAVWHTEGRHVWRVRVTQRVDGHATALGPARLDSCPVE
jgi:hypothetical protein